MVARLQPVGGRCRRLHRARRSSRRNRRRKADLPEPGAGGDQVSARHRGPRADPRRSYDAIMEGAVERVRPKMMTVVAIMAGLLPIMWEHRHRFKDHAAHCGADVAEPQLTSALPPFRFQ
jgi:hypothetical protein